MRTISPLDRLRPYNEAARGPRRGLFDVLRQIGKQRLEVARDRLHHTGLRMQQHVERSIDYTFEDKPSRTTVFFWWDERGRHWTTEHLENSAKTICRFNEYDDGSFDYAKTVEKGNPLPAVQTFKSRDLDGLAATWQAARALERLASDIEPPAVITVTGGSHY